MIRFGLIGLGRWGRNFAKTLKELDELSFLKFSAICSSQPDALSVLPPGGQHFKDAAAMISSGAIDAIIIATPPKTHGPLLRLALERQMPAIVEKPLALSLSETESLKQAIETSHTSVLVDYIHLHHPAFLALVSAIANDKIVSISSLGGGPGPIRPDYSALWDYGPHDLSMQIFLAKGETPNVICTEGSVQNFSAEISFPSSGIQGFFSCSNEWQAKRRIIEVQNKTEIFRLEDGVRPMLTRAPISNPEAKTAIAFQTESPLASLIRRFVNGIESKRFGLEWKPELSVTLANTLEKIEFLLRKNDRS